MKNEKKRVSALIYCDANGAIAHRPAVIDFNFATEPQTIQKGWEKTRLTKGFDFDKE